MRVVAQYRLVFFVSPFYCGCLSLNERFACSHAGLRRVKQTKNPAVFQTGFFYVFVHFMNKMCRTYFLQTRKVHFQAQKHEKK